MSADRRFDDLVSAYFDGSIDSGGLEELNALLASDASCARRFVLLSRVHASMRELQGTPVPLGESAHAGRRRRAAGPFVAAAAATLLAVGIMFFPTRRITEPTAGTSGGPGALFVVGRVDPDLTPGDRAVLDRLGELGFHGVPVREDEVTGGLVRAHALVIVSESVRSDRVGESLRAAPVPILNCEPHLNFALGLSRDPGGASDHFAKTHRFRVRIVAPDHPLAAGLRDLVRVYRSEGTVGWGRPAEAAARVAVCDDDPNQAALFARETPGGGRRVSFFLSDRESGATLLTPEGWRLFDAAVRWLAGR